MVNIKALTLAALATFTSLVAADPCQSDRLYCGDDLLGIGDYAAAIDEALTAAGEPVDDNTRHNGLFYCANDDSGDISWDSTCEHCVYGGAENDHC